MGDHNLQQGRKLGDLFFPSPKSGAIMLVMLVLSLAVLPTAGVAITIAQNDLTAALDDWHRYQAQEAAKAALLQIEHQLKRGEPVSPRWPDDEVQIAYSVRTLVTRWEVTVQASSKRAKVRIEKTIPRNP